MGWIGYGPGPHWGLVFKSSIFKPKIIWSITPTKQKKRLVWSYLFEKKKIKIRLAPKAFLKIECMYWAWNNYFWNYIFLTKYLLVTSYGFDSTVQNCPPFPPSPPVPSHVCVRPKKTKKGGCLKIVLLNNFQFLKTKSQKRLFGMLFFLCCF